LAGILIQHLAKKFGTSSAIEDISLEVKDGEFAVFLGPSGSGKTTLLRCLAGLENPDAGTVSIGDKEMNGVSARDREISMVFQNYALFPLMTVRANIGFPLRVRGTSKETMEKKVTELAKRLGIEGLLDKRPKQLSGGEQQRVAIGRALIRETNAILMDEPLSNLDAPLRAQLRLELKALQRDFGRTIVYVTHDQAEAMTLADRIGVIRNGRLIQYDTPSRIYAFPSSSFVAGFVGSPPASIFRMTVRKSGDSLSLVAPGVDLIVPDIFVETLRKREDGEVDVAIRAEGVDVVRTPGEGVEGIVELVETLGANTIINLKVGEFRLRSVTAGIFEAQPGTHVWARIDLMRAGFFDPLTENRLVHVS
jgi:multiple sugar transport system ATP-binding protein